VTNHNVADSRKYHLTTKQHVVRCKWSWYDAIKPKTISAFTNWGGLNEWERILIFQDSRKLVPERLNEGPTETEKERPRCDPAKRAGPTTDCIWSWHMAKAQTQGPATAASPWLLGQRKITGRVTSAFQTSVSMWGWESVWNLHINIMRVRFY